MVADGVRKLRASHVHLQSVALERRDVSLEAQHPSLLAICRKAV